VTFTLRLHQDDPVYSKLDAITQQLAQLTVQMARVTAGQAQERNTMSKLDDAIAQLQQQVEQETTVEQSAKTFIDGVPTLIQNAVQQALAAGATQQQLQALTDLGTKIQASSQTLAQSVTTNTPSA